MNLRVSSIYRLVFIIGALIFIIDGFTDDYISEFLTINTFRIIKSFEMWRFFTFPLSFGILSNLILSFLTLVFITPTLRKQINTGVLDFTLFVNLLLLGLVMFITQFTNRDIQYYGIEGLCLYILTYYGLINKSKYFRFFKSIKIPKFYLPLSISFIWLSATGLIFLINDVNINIYVFAPTIYGVSTGFIAYFILRSEIRDVKSHSKQKLENPQQNFIIDERELSPAYIFSDNLMKKQPLKEIKKRYYFTKDSTTNEFFLNEILEKINTHGKDSLTEEEINFLNEYSKNS